MAKQFGMGTDKKVTEGPWAITQSLFLQIVENEISNLNQSFAFCGFLSCMDTTWAGGSDVPIQRLSKDSYDYLNPSSYNLIPM